MIKPSAVKEITTIPRKKDRQQITQKIKRLSINPRPPGTKKLSGQERYRIRHGQYRIIYGIEDKKLIVYVVKIGHRKEIYKSYSVSRIGYVARGSVLVAGI